MLHSKAAWKPDNRRLGKKNKTKKTMHIFKIYNAAGRLMGERGGRYFPLHTDVLLMQLFPCKIKQGSNHKKK